MASIEAETNEAEAGVCFQEMTFSKTCQIESFAAPSLAKHLITKHGFDTSSSVLEVPIELLGCVYKAKHSLIIRTPELCSHNNVKFRLCDFHFDWLHNKFEKGDTDVDDDKVPFFRFRRNRL